MKTRRFSAVAKAWKRLALVLVWLLAPGYAVAEDKTTLDEQLIEAAGRGDVAGVESLLGQGAKANGTSEFGGTALKNAVDSGDPAVVKLLLERGANVNAKLKDGSTALMWATISGSGEVVKLLLEKGANVNATAGNGSTALKWAAVMEQRETAELLKAAGAEVTLPIAALFGDKVEVRRLLDAGADVNAADAQGWTPLMNAVQKGHADVVQLLLYRGANAKAERKDGSTAMNDALDSGKADVITLFLDTSGRPAFLSWFLDGRHALTSRGQQGFDSACYWGQIEVVRLLLDKGAAVNRKDSNGATALMAACEGAQLEVVKMLLDKGAEVNPETKWGMTALDYSRGAIEELLKAHGARKGSHRKQN